MYRVEFVHWNLKQVPQNSMGNLCSCWDAVCKVIILQHNEIKTSCEQILHVMSHTFKLNIYKRPVGNMSKYVMLQIVEEFDLVKHVEFDCECCDCMSLIMLNMWNLIVDVVTAC